RKDRVPGVTPVASSSRGVARRRGAAVGAALSLCLFTPLGACGAASPHEPARPRTGMTQPGARPGVEHGLATFYGLEQRGGPTASGERFDPHQLTAAHRTLPFGTWVRVTNTKNGRSVNVRINDRGPYGKGRIIDVSEEAARRLGMLDAGVVPVTVEVLR
ncbi:MAG TPA: septal ring lytic transglycosylase RlpA family protein, partial [Kofleriaceae bacterium]